MKRDVIIVVACLVLITCPGCLTATGNSSTVGDQLNAGIQAVHTMTNVFLCDVIQSKLLTSLPAEYTASTDALINSITDHWQTWTTHYIGYVVCAVIGIVGFVVMLLVALIFPCCRCCGRCGAKDPQLLNKKRKSRCCIRFCELSLVVVTISLILANLAMYGVNEKLYPQLKTGLVDQTVKSLSDIDTFLKLIPLAIKGTVLGGFVQLETSLFRTLDAIPANGMKAIDNATGVVTSLTELSTFSDNSLSLNTTMIDAIQLADTLDQQTVALWNDFTTINNSMATTLTSCPLPGCVDVLGLLSATRVSVNFTAVNETLIPKQVAVDLAIQLGLIDQVNSSMSQLTNVNDTIKNTMRNSTHNVKDQCGQVAAVLQDAMTQLNDSLGNIDISELSDTIVSMGDSIPADIIYYVIIGLSAVISIIIISNIIGVLLGILLPPCRLQPSTKKHKKGCGRKSTGSHFLLLSVALTFLFYWIYLMIVLILFLVGGLTETELCRPMMTPNAQSAGVLAIYDSLIDQTLDVENLTITPFHLYGQCARGATIYTALNLEKSWNLTELINTEDLSKAIDDLKSTDITIPQVNLTNAIFKTILNDLENALGQSQLNVTKLIEDVSGSIISPDLRLIRDGAQNVIANGGPPALNTDITALNALINSRLDNIESTRQALVVKLVDIRTYIGNINFTATSLTLESGQQEINTNGSGIVGQFINDTGDVIYYMIVNFSDRTVNAIKNSVAVCTPFYTVLSQLLDAACVQTLYPLNSFWFSLGWCLAFLVPSLIMAVKLATVYRYTQVANGVGHSDD